MNKASKKIDSGKNSPKPIFTILAKDAQLKQPNSPKKKVNPSVSI
jgi:hypothetical protein